MVLLVFVPLIVGAGMSLFTYDHGRFYFSGFSNFKEILMPRGTGPQARSFYYSLIVTTLWTLFNVVLHVAIGIGMALLLRPPGTGSVRRIGSS